jgi:predicted Zn-dependent protease with MMP-like domain
VPDRTRTRRRRRDRRGRGLRGPLLPSGLPGALSRSERFDELVLAELTRLSRRLGDRLADVELVVADVPPAGEDEVQLYRVRAATEGRPARLVVHRRPVEARARGLRALEDLVHHVVVEGLAELVGVEPEELDPEHGED